MRNEGRVKESTCIRRKRGKGERGSVVREESRKEGQIGEVGWWKREGEGW